MTSVERPGALWRLVQFRARNPGVVIQRDNGFGFWQAWIPVSNGGTVITRYVLQDLLDTLEDLLSTDRSQGSGGPGPPGRSAGPDHQDDDQ